MWMLRLKGLTRFQWLLKEAEGSSSRFIDEIRIPWVVYPDFNLPRYAITMHFEY